MDLLSTGPLAVWRANMDLALRLEQLRQQWHQADRSAAGDVPPMSPAAALPAQALWRHLHRQLGSAWSVGVIEDQAQRDYAQGVQDAVHAWQRSLTQILAPGVVQGGPMGVAMREFTASCWGVRPLP